MATGGQGRLEPAPLRLPLAVSPGSRRRRQLRYARPRLCRFAALERRPRPTPQLLYTRLRAALGTPAGVERLRGGHRLQPATGATLGTEPRLPAQVRRRPYPAAARQRPGAATGDPGPRPATQRRTAPGLRTGRPQHPGKPLRPGDAGHPQPGRQPAPAERPELPLRPGKLRDLLRRQGQQPDLAAVQPTGVACRRTLAAAGRRDARRRRGLRQLVQPAAGGELPVQPPAQPARGLFGGGAVAGHVRKRRRLALPGPPPDTGALRAERSLLLRQRPRPRRPGQGTHPFARDRLQRFFPRDRAGHGCAPVPRGNHRTDQRSAQRRRLQPGQRRSHPLLRRGRPARLAPGSARPPPTPISTTTPPVATTGA